MVLPAVLGQMAAIVHAKLCAETEVDSCELWDTMVSISRLILNRKALSYKR